MQATPRGQRYCSTRKAYVPANGEYCRYACTVKEAYCITHLKEAEPLDE